LLLLVFAASVLSAQPTATADGDLWAAAVEQLRHGEFGSDRGELVIVDETIPTAAFHELPDSTRELALVMRLRQRNAVPKRISDIRLPPNTRLVSASAALGNQFPGATIVRLSLPAFSEDGTRAIINYVASRGFDDSRGAYVIFDKKEGKWVVVDYLAPWIT
jgi:hypothetical protein